MAVVYNILLVGYPKAGKDTFFKELKAYEKDFEFIRIAFADPLKEEVYTMLKALDIKWDLDEQTNKNFSRILVNWLGQFRRKHSCPSYWVQKALVKYQTYIYESSKTKPLVFVFTDVRQFNEYSALINQPGTTHVIYIEDGTLNLKEKLKIFLNKVNEPDLDIKQIIKNAKATRSFKHFINYKDYRFLLDVRKWVVETLYDSENKPKKL